MFSGMPIFLAAYLKLVIAFMELIGVFRCSDFH
jgi:hypothetical protein